MMRPAQTRIGAYAVQALCEALVRATDRMFEAGMVSDSDGFEMLLVTADGSWHLRRPLLAFPRQPVGVGDLTSGLFLARVLLGDSLLAAFEFTAAAVHEVLLETQACASYELELVRAQDRIAHPRVRFEATPIGL